MLFLKKIQPFRELPQVGRQGSFVVIEKYEGVMDYLDGAIERTVQLSERQAPCKRQRACSGARSIAMHVGTRTKIKPTFAELQERGDGDIL